MNIKKILVRILPVATLVACSSGSGSSGGNNNESEFNYPASQYTNASNTYFGTTIADPYQWMESTNSPETLAWVNQQNVFTDNYIHNLPEYNAVAAGLAALSKSAKSFEETPTHQNFVKVGDTYYYTNVRRINNITPEFNSEKNNTVSVDNIIYVTDDKNENGKVFLDLNKTNILKGAVSVQQFGIIDGAESYTVIKTQDVNLDLGTITVINNQTLQPVQRIPNIYGAFTIYESGFFYVQPAQVTDIYTSSYNSQKLYYYQINTRPVTIFEAGSAIGSIDLDSSLYNNLLYFYAGYANGNNQVYSFDPSSLNNSPQIFLAGEIPASFRIIDSTSDEKLLVETNQGAAQKRWVIVNPSKPNSSNWINVVPPNPESAIANYITSCGNYYYVEILVNGVSKFYRYDQTIPASNPIEIDGFSGLGALDSDGVDKPVCGDDKKTLTYVYSNLVTPDQKYTYNPDTQQQGTVQDEENIPGFNPDDYEMKEIFVPSTGGAQVSIFIGYKKGLQLNGNNPALIYVYGGFNVSTLPSFNRNALLLMRSGGIYVVAQVRGGGEYGTAWYDAGRMLNKQNTYNDVAAVANYLIDNGYTNPAKLALSGASNGGLTTAATALQNPDLFKVVFPGVGVLDLLRYQLFTVGFGWYPDYGYSTNLEQFNNLMTFSPLQNVQHIAYPTMLIQTGSEDGRVPPLHSYKFAATMQNVAIGDNPYLLRSYFGAGHNLLSQYYVDMWTLFFNETKTTVQP